MEHQSDTEDRLLRKLDQITDSLENKTMALKQSRTALENAHATIAFLQEQCRQLIQIASEAGADTQKFSDIVDLISSADNTDWLSDLRTEAFARGFEDGWVYSKTNTAPLPSAESDRFTFYQSRVVSIWDAKPRFSSLRFKQARKNQPLLRFDHSESGGFEISEYGDFIRFDDYVKLQFSLDSAREELAGYYWLLRTPDPVKPAPNWRSEACTNNIRIRSKAGAVRLQYGRNKRECDLFVIYGDGVPSCDRILFLNLFSSKRINFDYESRLPRFESTMEEELLARGYDLSTLRLTIQKKL